MRAVDVLEYLFNRDGGRGVLGVDIDADVNVLEFLGEHGWITRLGIGMQTLQITDEGRAVMAVVIEGRDVGGAGARWRPVEEEPDAPTPVRPVAIPRPPTYELAKVNQERLAQLATIYGISQDAVLNIAVSDLYDGKMVSYRDAEED